MVGIDIFRLGYINWNGVAIMKIKSPAVQAGNACYSQSFCANKTMPSLSGSLGWIMRARMGVNVHRED